MKTSTTVLALVFGFLQLSLIASSRGIPGYVLSSEKGLPNNILKETPKVVTYNDKDAKDLILHNLGLLDNPNQVSSSGKDLISQLGTKNLFSSEKLNFAFLLEGKTPQALFDSDRKVLTKSNLKHQTALFNICADDESECLINHLFNKNNDQSVISKIQKGAGKRNVEAYFYNTESKVIPGLGSNLGQSIDKKGNLFIIDPNSNSQFKITNNLESCVNNVLKGKFEVDIAARTITPVQSSSESSESPVSVPEQAQKDFTQFMTDICSIWGVSTLIRRDSNPSLFAFHIESLGKLEQFLSANEINTLYQVFNVAYEKFFKQVANHYEPNEVSGQIFIMNPENHIDSIASENGQFIQTSEKFNKARVLQEESGVGTISSNPTTMIIFKSVLIVFALATAWVCIEMFNMDIQKDSVVYAKFLAADYFRR